MESEEAYNLYHRKEDFLKGLKADGFYVTEEGHIQFKRSRDINGFSSENQIGYIIEGGNFPPHLIITRSHEEIVRKGLTLREAYSKLRRLAEEFDSRK